MRRKPIIYPLNAPPHLSYPRVKRIYERPQILLDPWEKKLHYNDFRPSRHNFNLNNPRDPRLPDRVDIRYYQNGPPRYLKPIYRDRDYEYPESNWNFPHDDLPERYPTAPNRYRRPPADFRGGFLSFPDRDYRRYQRDVLKDFRDEDLLRDDSRTHVTVYHPRQPNKREFPKVYHYKRRNWKFPDFDNESRDIDFTSENELDSNLPSLGTNVDSLNANYHQRRDYKLPNFKSYDDWRIQKRRAQQLSTIPAKPKLRREHFWSVDSIPTEDRHRRRDIPNFKTHADWNVPRDRNSVSTIPNPFPDQDDFPSSIAPLESRVEDGFSTKPFPKRSTYDASSLVRPYIPKPRKDPDLQDNQSVGTRNDQLTDIPVHRSIRDDRISNANSDRLSAGVANRSTDSRQLDPVFKKGDDPKKVPKSVGTM
ncbi:uncharacterized protein LOC126814452 isoform X1 [Patella vulgata]|uniref:uncharacterized protein LOC126814452 isoform X1 n=1 Tax=Patella vulgata TaxID=6465 RepID=UPI0021808577|nr:uncharacterized protein LOC126814452 isoform X1 [Patella vulgata]XP_055955445.1 uncharacterized protein LOC126814452 isoform X1 [Patella vulgata]XP_055955446.1 uncharacterized protein LOC126814452 isoform X1 [Patella vulgata]